MEKTSSTNTKRSLVRSPGHVTSSHCFWVVFSELILESVCYLVIMSAVATLAALMTIIQQLKDIKHCCPLSPQAAVTQDSSSETGTNGTSDLLNLSAFICMKHKEKHHWTQRS